jgi:hypothetical protein
MEHLFVPYNIALTLKEKGFKGTTINSMYYHIHYGTLHDYSYFSVFENMLDAPIYQEVMDWLWFNYQIKCGVNISENCYGNDGNHFQYHKVYPFAKSYSNGKSYPNKKNIKIDTLYIKDDNISKERYKLHYRYLLIVAIEEALKLI